MAVINSRRKNRALQMGTWRIAQHILIQNMYQEEDEQRSGRSLYLSEGENARIHTYCSLLSLLCSSYLLARHVHCHHFPRPPVCPSCLPFTLGRTLHLVAALFGFFFFFRNGEGSVKTQLS